MTGSAKLMTAGGGGVVLTPASSIASDVTVQVPSVAGTLVCSDSSGNVGIGTSSPANTLEVATGANGGINIKQTGSAQTGFLNFRAFDGSLNGRIAYDNSADAMKFYTVASERMRIDSSGNLLVGTTTAYGTETVARSTSGYTYASVSVSNQSEHFVFKNDATTVGSITRSGGTGVAYNTSSDYRLKENIKPMQNALATVTQLNPVTYTWKADGSDGQGFIAHELQAVVPDCVTGEKDAVDAEGKPVYQGIDTSFLVATLTKAIQEQQEQINALTAKVAALEAK